MSITRILNESAAGREVRCLGLPRRGRRWRCDGKETWTGTCPHLLDEMARLFRASAGAMVSSAVQDLTGSRARSVEDFAAAST